MKRKTSTWHNYLPRAERQKFLKNLPLYVTMPPEAHDRLKKLMAAHGSKEKSRIVVAAIMAMLGPNGEAVE